MQQEVISFGAPTSRRTCPHLDCASTERQNTNCNNFTSGNHVRGARFNAYVASARHCTTEAMVSKLAIIIQQMRVLLAHACETSVLRPVGRPGQTFYKVDGAERASFSRTDVQTNKWYTLTPCVNSADARPRTIGAFASKISIPNARLKSSPTTELASLFAVPTLQTTLGEHNKLNELHGE